MTALHEFDFEQDQNLPAPTDTEVHQQWHNIYGWDRACPLDCGITETYDDYWDVEERHMIRCGHCGGSHPSVAVVKECSRIHTHTLTAVKES